MARILKAACADFPFSFTFAIGSYLVHGVSECVCVCKGETKGNAFRCMHWTQRVILKVPLLKKEYKCTKIVSNSGSYNIMSMRNLYINSACSRLCILSTLGHGFFLSLLF